MRDHPPIAGAQDLGALAGRRGGPTGCGGGGGIHGSDAVRDIAVRDGGQHSASRGIEDVDPFIRAAPDPGVADQQVCRNGEGPGCPLAGGAS